MWQIKLETWNLQANPFWKYIVLHIPNLYKSNVKKNNTKSHRNEYRQKNENPTNPKKSMDLPANNACFQADSFMSERIVGRDWWNERTKANTRARESGRELEEKAQHIFHFPLQVKKHMNYGCEQANSARIWSLNQTALGSPWSSPSPSPPLAFSTLLPSIPNFLLGERAATLGLQTTTWGQDTLV